MTRKKYAAVNDFVFLDCCELERSGFCNECPEIVSEADISYSYCKVDFDMSNPRCARYSRLVEVLEELDKVNETLGEVCANNRRMACSDYYED